MHCSRLNKIAARYCWYCTCTYSSYVVNSFFMEVMKHGICSSPSKALGYYFVAQILRLVLRYDPKVQSVEE